MLRKYLVWFRGNRERTETIIAAPSKTEAIAKFAEQNTCQPSAYIAARLAGMSTPARLAN